MSDTPRPTIPTPAALAARRPTPVAPPVVPAHSESARFGRVDDSGTVFVQDGDGEREVGSYPGASADEALQYFARKYDDLFAAAELLHSRLSTTEVAAKEAAESLAHLKEQTTEPQVVGDLGALADKVSELDALVQARREAEAAAKALARESATTEREALVAEAEAIAGTPVEKVQWKQSTDRMRALLDEWKSHQRSSVRLDKTTENTLWQRFSQARNSFDKSRRTHFSQLEESQAGAKRAKEALVAEAEKLATSKDWAQTARTFKQLMSQWRQAGRASRTDDNALWDRFKAAQDAFFEAKDAVDKAEDEQFRANLAVKDKLLVEAQALVPVADLDKAKQALRSIQDRWDKAGKVPRSDMERVEGAMRKIESEIRSAEESQWKATNPEVQARASSMVTQLENSLAQLRDDLAKAQSTGNSRKVAELTAKVAAQESWLEQARGGLGG